LPEPIVKRARELLKEFEKSSPQGKATSGGQLSLFEPLPDSVRQRLEETDVDSLTPMEAMNILHELRETLRTTPDAGTGSGLPNA